MPIAMPTMTGLRQRRVDHAPFAELVEEALRHPEDAAARADVLAEQDEPVVGRHLVVERVADRGDEVRLGHETAGRCRRRTRCASPLPGRGQVRPTPR